MKKSKQFSFFNEEVKSQKFFGGALVEGRRKSMRPLTSKESIHFVLRSSWAVGSDSFLKLHNRRRIDQIINRFAKKFGVCIYQRSINSNHLHLLLRITNRRLYRSFIKAVSGQIASHVMGQQCFLDFSSTRREPLAGNGSSSSNGGQNKASGIRSGLVNQVVNRSASVKFNEAAELDLKTKANRGWERCNYSKYLDTKWSFGESNICWDDGERHSRRILSIL